MTFKHLIIAATLGAPVAATAAEYFDGSHTLLCTINEVFECNITTECTELVIEELGAPRYFHVDFEGERLVTTRLAAETRESAFHSFERIDDKLFLQGSEDSEEGVRDGAAWTLSIADPDGTMALGMLRNDAVLSGFGACVPID